MSQKCLLLIGDLVAEPDSEVDRLVRTQLLAGVVAKVADSKVVVRKAASQARIRMHARAHARAAVSLYILPNARRSLSRQR